MRRGQSHQAKPSGMSAVAPFKQPISNFCHREVQSAVKRLPLTVDKKCIIALLPNRATLNLGTCTHEEVLTLMTDALKSNDESAVLQLCNSIGLFGQMCNNSLRYGVVDGTNTIYGGTTNPSLPLMCCVCLDKKAKLKVPYCIGTQDGLHDHINSEDHRRNLEPMLGWGLSAPEWADSLVTQTRTGNFAILKSLTFSSPDDANDVSACTQSDYTNNVTGWCGHVDVSTWRLPPHLVRPHKTNNHILDTKIAPVALVMLVTAFHWADRPRNQTFNDAKWYLKMIVDLAQIVARHDSTSPCPALCPDPITPLPGRRSNFMVEPFTDDKSHVENQPASPTLTPREAADRQDLMLRLNALETRVGQLEARVGPYQNTVSLMLQFHQLVAQAIVWITVAISNLGNDLWLIDGRDAANLHQALSRPDSDPNTILSATRSMQVRMDRSSDPSALVEDNILLQLAQNAVDTSTVHNDAASASSDDDEASP